MDRNENRHEELMLTIAELIIGFYVLRPIVQRAKGY